MLSCVWKRRGLMGYVQKIPSNQRVHTLCRRSSSKDRFSFPEEERVTYCPYHPSLSARQQDRRLRHRRVRLISWVLLIPSPGFIDRCPRSIFGLSWCRSPTSVTATMGTASSPDVAADVSPTQNVEFINYLGLYVWAKPALPVASPAPTPQAITSLASFWCIGNGANNQPLPGCGNGIPLPGYNLGDTQVGYDKLAWPDG